LTLIDRLRDTSGTNGFHINTHASVLSNQEQERCHVSLLGAFCLTLGSQSFSLLLESELFGHEEGAFTGATRARRGDFELAHHGTIFLDEIGEMPLHLQVKLLRVLEDRNLRRVGSERPVEIDVRIMAATNRDVKLEMEQDRFRADLYYRLAVVALTVPPLRDRREDIPALAQMFLARIGKQFGRSVSRFDPDALRALVEHDWPGNVRELINVIERAVLLAREDVNHLGSPDSRTASTSGRRRSTARTSPARDRGRLRAPLPALASHEDRRPHRRDGEACRSERAYPLRADAALQPEKGRLQGLSLDPEAVRGTIPAITWHP
jgi:transcriptional regulator with GAF, ATPase, and Fis domain